MPEATLRVGPAALLRGHLLVEELSVREPAFLRVPEFPPADPPPPPSDPMEWLRPSFLKPLGSDIAGYLKLATVERLRVEGFRLGQDVMGLPLTATLEGGGPLTDFRNSVDVVLSRPQEGDGPARPLLAVSGSLNLGNAGGWLADAGKDVHPDLAAGLDLRLAVHGAAEPPSSPEEGSLRTPHPSTAAGERFGCTPFSVCEAACLLAARQLGTTGATTPGDEGTLPVSRGGLKDGPLAERAHESETDGTDAPAARLLVEKTKVAGQLTLAVALSDRGLRRNDD